MNTLKNFSLNTKIALGVLAAVLLWLLSGLFSSDDADASHAAANHAAPHVSIEDVQAERYTRHLTLIGRSEADVTVKLSAQTSGSVVSIPIAKGDTVSAGTPLLNININTRMEDLAAAKAAFKAETVQVTSARKLHKEGFASDTTLAQKEAALAAAEQQIARIERDIAYTTVHAPLSSVVEKQLVEVGDYVQTGDPLFELVGQDRFLIVGFAAQQDRSLIQKGQKASATLANGQEVEGVIHFVATQADEATRTYRVEMLVDGTVYTIPTGMTAHISIPTQEQWAYHLAHSVMVLADDGRVGVMLEEEGKAIFHAVTLLKDASDGVWVTDLPEQRVRLITRGQASLEDGSDLHLDEKETTKTEEDLEHADV